MQKKKIGSKEWFIERAISSLREEKDGVWDYSDSVLLWSPETVEVYRQVQQNSTEYGQVVTNQETLLIKEVAHSVINLLPEKFTYIDLGPGTEHKEKYFLDQIKAQNKQIVYVPVDINKPMLELAEEAAKGEGFEVWPIQSTFEEVPETLDRKHLPEYCFVSIGQTFTNYKLEDVAGVLKEIIGPSGSAFVTFQERSRIADLEKVKNAYRTPDNFSIRNIKLSLIGINPDTDVEPIEITDDLEFYYTLKQVPTKLSQIGMRAGDKIRFARSYRYDLDTLKSRLLKSYDDVTFFDKGYSFVGALLK